MHRWSQLFIPTLREAPADAEVASHKFLVRAGYIRQLGAGIYSFLFLGNRSINKIMAIVRQEMDKIGQEFYLPALHPREIWEDSGRWTVMGENMFRLKDRKGADFALGMTHEEVMTDIARKELRSYKQLPQIWYQIQTEVSRRAAAEVGTAAGAPVHHEGCLLVRHRRRRTGRFLSETLRRLLPDLRPLRVEVHGDRRALGRDGRIAVAGVHGADAGGRRSDCQLREVQLRGEHGKGYFEAGRVEDLEAEGDGKPLEVHTPGRRRLKTWRDFWACRRRTRSRRWPADDGREKTAKDGQGRESRAVVVLMRGDHQMNEAKLNERGRGQRDASDARRARFARSSILLLDTWVRSGSTGPKT